MGLLSGLANMGLGGLEKEDIFQSEDSDVKKSEEIKIDIKEPVFSEDDYLFDKKCQCPICGANFTYRSIKTGKLKLVGTDSDLRPRYDKMDPSKYDAIICTACGYGALSRFFQDPLPVANVKLVKENICGKVRGVPNKPILDYDDAIQRYQIVLASSMVKRAKDSEKAYVCLKLGWLIRGKKETLDLDLEDFDEQMKKLNEDENEAMRSAFEGFIAARGKESFPMVGMDEMTVDYLLANLAARFKHYDIAQKLIGAILLSKTANSRIKDKARDLKEQIKIDMEMSGLL